MKIDIWSDFACPFCYIGKRNLDMALKELNYQGEVQIVFHSFQLDPDARKGENINSVEKLANKYGISKEEAKAMIDRVVKMAKNVGLNYNYDSLIETNTFDAHRLTHFAQKKNKGIEVTERLFEAHFIDSLDIGDIEALGNIGENIGLNREEIISMLNTDEFYSEVNNDIYKAVELEINSVPFFIINDKYAISGAQPTKAFVATLKRSLE